MRYPDSPAPLSNQDTYTSWPGGVDPTARVYDSVGGKRKARVSAKTPKSGLRRRKTPRRRTTRKTNRKTKARRFTRRY